MFTGGIGRIPAQRMKASSSRVRLGSAAVQGCAIGTVAEAGIRKNPTPAPASAADCKAMIEGDLAMRASLARRSNCNAVIQLDHSVPAARVWNAIPRRPWRKTMMCEER